MPTWRPEDLQHSMKCLYQYLSQYSSHVLSSFKLSTILASSCFVACILVALVLRSCRLSNKPDKALDSTQALFSVIVPTSVAWPRHYTHLVDHVTSSRFKTVSISMTSLICNICDGIVEFRDHKELEELLFGKLVAYGWRFDLALDTFLNVEVLRWVVYNHFSCRQPKLNVKPRQNFKRTRGASRPKEDNSPAPIFHSLTSDSYLEIDCVPFSRLDTSLRQLRDTLKPGAAATLEFTTPAPSISFLSSEFNICAVPFLPRKYATPPPKTPHLSTPRPNRTATPLLASIHRVLEHLTAGPSALTLESLTNVSEMYADGLIAAVERLEDDRAARTAFVNQWGAAGLREELFMMAWEAALFRSGRHLIRWIVVVRK